MCLWHLSKLKTRLRSVTKLLLSNRVTSENKRIHTPPSSPPFKVEVFLVLISRQLEQRHNIAWRGQGKKSYILPFNLRSVKRQKAPLGRSVATSFVTDCSYSLFILFSAPTHTEFEGKVTKSHSQEVFQLSAGYPEIYSL